MSRHGRQIKQNIELIKSLGDKRFIRDVLKSRSSFLKLRALHEKALREIYEKSIDSVAERLAEEESATKKAILKVVQEQLQEEIFKINKATESLMEKGIQQSFDFGGSAAENYFLDAIRETRALSLSGARSSMIAINREAVLSFWNRVTENGMTISETIWSKGPKIEDTVIDFIEVGLATGRDSIEVARDLEKYVRKGSKTLAEYYPNMMVRMKKRIPKDICYEALRLIRTEYTTAFTEATIKRGQRTPGYKGVQWILSDSHPITDICDVLAETDAHGLGVGVYPRGKEPVMPHPNCLCYLVAVLIEREEFINDLKRWSEGESVDYLDEWKENYYEAF
ncbi:hypothetical protein U472_00430 [Orenia metallireducens]|uniref:Phage Mu protein F like protein n=1 Tax=Orenia metallireducens TaxID=1413210 RepID=A0A1C0ADD9_9FIRM|nr:hypothetical protein [Orenia metallireducens]OCL28655.1 hypothetical protein U472_00430 [Orenia metallireducens]